MICRIQWQGLSKVSVVVCAIKNDSFITWKIIPLRWSTASAYLRPALERKNLSTEEEVLVTRVIFEGKKAVGIEYVNRKGQV